MLYKLSILFICFIFLHRSDNDLCIKDLTQDVNVNQHLASSNKSLNSFMSLDSFTILDSLSIANPSFEDSPRRGGLGLNNGIKAWFDCGAVHFEYESPPDIHPTLGQAWQVKKEAYHGKTYLGLVVRDNDSYEALSQKISKPIEKGNCYVLSVFMSQSKNYVSHSRITEQEVNYTKPAVFRIWGGDRFCGRNILLGESKAVNHNDWREYIFEIQAKRNHEYILIESFYETPILIPYSGHILVDGMSPIYQVECK